VTDFDGETYVPERDDDPGSDRERLARQLDCVRREMSDHNWHTLDELAAACHGSEAGVSARIRDLRKPKHGSHVVERRYAGGGLHEYRLAASGPMPPPRGAISPYRIPPTPKPKRVEADDVPAPEIWFCWHCGAKTSNVKQHALGGFAEVICPEANRRVIGVPSRDLVGGDGTHKPRSARSPLGK
jgi:hypothetical protein